jgi:hypothetical protein
VLNIKADTLTLSGPIDGLLPDEWIGLASVTPSQNRIRFEKVDDLSPGDEMALSGLDTANLQPVFAQTRIQTIDATSGTVTLVPIGANANYRLRPEALTVAAMFNANFANAFASFAREQNLYVCWLGCQEQNHKPTDCPGASAPADPCTGNGAALAPCGQNGG